MSGLRLEVVSFFKVAVLEVASVAGCCMVLVGVMALAAEHNIDIIHPLPKVCNPLMVFQDLIYVIEVKSQKTVPMSHHLTKS